MPRTHISEDELSALRGLIATAELSGPTAKLVLAFKDEEALPTEEVLLSSLSLVDTSGIKYLSEVDGSEVVRNWTEIQYLKVASEVNQEEVDV